MPLRARSTRLAAFVLAATAAAATPAFAQQPAEPARHENDFILQNFAFRSGEMLPQLRIHYTTLGEPARDAQGRVTNAVLILHGTGGSGSNFLLPIFAGELFGPGQLLDASKYFIILPDGIGHGKSSKPSDGLRMKYPSYDYDDMVEAQYRLVTDGLGVNHLRLIMGTSMGCMHSFVWGEAHPDFMDALMPLACLPVQIAGRNRFWRKMAMDAIRDDPDWKNGDYTEEPRDALRTWVDIVAIVGGTPRRMQQAMPSREAVDRTMDEYYRTRTEHLDANDTLYQLNASRNYDPSPRLNLIQAPVMWINSADDFINPPELGIAEVQVKNIKNARFILLPESEQTFGHGTHTHAATWKQYLAELLNESNH